MRLAAEEARLQPLLGTTVAHFVVGILAVFAPAVIAACGGTASPIAATSEPTALTGSVAPLPVTPTAPPPALAEPSPTAEPPPAPAEPSPTAPPAPRPNAPSAPTPTATSTPMPRRPTSPSTPWPVILPPPRGTELAPLEADPGLTLGAFPGNWSSIFFATFPTRLERDRLEDLVGLDVSTLPEDMDKALGPQWARAFGVTSMAFRDHELTLWSNGAVFAGDFGGLIDILREAASTSAATVQMYRGLEFFKVTIPQ